MSTKPSIRRKSAGLTLKQEALDMLDQEAKKFGCQRNEVVRDILIEYFVNKHPDRMHGADYILLKKKFS